MKAEIGIEESLDLMQAVDYRGAAINLTRAPADFLAEVMTKKGVPQLSFNPRGLEWKCSFNFHTRLKRQFHTSKNH